MITSGLYKAERHEGIFDDYEVVMTVKETPKSYCFTLESIDSDTALITSERCFRNQIVS